ncbi:hypothetical protein Hanom_Chr15g01377841 [Helianthus anomalus]
MEMKMRCGAIEVTSKAIHKLLGIPRGGKCFSSIKKLVTKDEVVCKWKDSYPVRFISPKMMVDMIEALNREDKFYLHMEFLMCFVTIMVEFHKQGSLRPGILKYILEDMKFEDMDWCWLFVEKMKKYKWVGEDASQGTPLQDC